MQKKEEKKKKLHSYYLKIRKQKKSGKQIQHSLMDENSPEKYNHEAGNYDSSLNRINIVKPAFEELKKLP